MAGPIVSTPFQRGRPVGWAELEALRNEIARLKPNSGVGYRLNQSPSGWSLSIPSTTGGGTKRICPFEVTTANEGGDWKFSVAWGMVGVPPVLPIGMQPNNDPPLAMTWNDGWVYMKVKFVTDDTAVEEVRFENTEEIPPADETYAYYPIAYIDTDSSGETPVQRIQNLCSAPIPSVCDLALPATP